jgi:hypothetical protein
MESHQLAAFGQLGGGIAAAKSFIRQGAPASKSSACGLICTAADTAQIFPAGQDALNHGRLDEAGRNFPKILAANPESGARPVIRLLHNEQ